MSDWAFLTNHALVLSLIAKHPRITARELALTINITERSVRKIIADLDASGYIKKKREGRRLRYLVDPDLPLRHETHMNIAIGDFLEALGWRRRRKKTTVAKGGVEKPKSTRGYQAPLLPGS